MTIIIHFFVSIIIKFRTFAKSKFMQMIYTITFNLHSYNFSTGKDRFGIFSSFFALSQGKSPADANRTKEIRMHRGAG